MSSAANQAIQIRFLEEQHEKVGEETVWSDSEVSETELADTMAALLTQSRPTHATMKRGPSPCPMHVVFVVDSSRSMNRKDVDGQRRIDAVFDMCQKLVEDLSTAHPQSSSFSHADVPDVVSMITFSSEARICFNRICCRVANGELCQARQLVKASEETRYKKAFEGVALLLEDARDDEDVRIIFLSDGRPHELAATQKHFQSVLLDAPHILDMKRFEVHTVAFGPDAHSFGDTYLKPLSMKTKGTFHVATLSQAALARAFTEMASSITMTRTSSSVTDTFTTSGSKLLAIPFDTSDIINPDELWCTASRKGSSSAAVLTQPPLSSVCHRICKVSQMRLCRGEGGLRTYVLAEKCANAKVQVQRQAFQYGGMRLVYQMRDGWAKNAGQKMVAKRLRDKRHADLDEMSPFCKNAALAISFVEPFKIACGAVDVDLFFVPCYLYEYTTEDAEAYFVGEQMLEGSFVKFNGNNGYVNDSAFRTEIMQAFSHFTFVKSHLQYMVVDIQGVVDRGKFILTDPQVLSHDKSFGKGDLGIKGWGHFFASHTCGLTCCALGLKEKQKDTVEQMSQERVCVVCQDAEVGAVVEPCGHSSMCQECTLKVMEMSFARCPLCREAFTSFNLGQYSSTYVATSRRSRPSGAAKKKLPQSGVTTPGATIARVGDERPESENCCVM